VRDAIPEHGSVQVVGLVLETTGQQPRAVQLDLFAVGILAPADGLVGAGNPGVAAGPRQAALLGDVEVAVLARGKLHHRIADHPALDVVVGVRALVDENGNPNPHLGGSQTDPLGRSHRCEHVANELVQLIAELGDGFGGCVHHRGAPAGDGTDAAAGGEVLGHRSSCSPVRRAEQQYARCHT